MKVERRGESMAGKIGEEIVRCSFCNKTQAQVRKMIAGPNGAYICDECVDVCAEIIEEELAYENPSDFQDINLLKPEEIKAFLDEYVIGQDEAKKCCQWQCTITINELWRKRILELSYRKVIF